MLRDEGGVVARLLESDLSVVDDSRSCSMPFLSADGWSMPNVLVSLMSLGLW